MRVLCKIALTLIILGLFTALEGLREFLAEGQDKSARMQAAALVLVELGVLLTVVIVWVG